MGLFKKKEKAEKAPVCDVRANNLFGKMLLDGENIEISIDGKCEAENLVFSVAVLSLTNKRCFYYKQDGSQAATESILFDKITSVEQISGFEDGELHRNKIANNRRKSAGYPLSQQFRKSKQNQYYHF